MTNDNQDLFQRIGVDVRDDKIHIDLAKTKDFFSALEGILKSKAETIQDEIADGKIDFAKDVGIKVENEHIDIDLGKTKSFMEEFGKKIEGFIAELDTAVGNIGKK